MRVLDLYHQLTRVCSKPLFLKVLLELQRQGFNICAKDGYMNFKGTFHSSNMGTLL